MSNLKSKITLKRVISAATVWTLLMALNVTGVLWTFYNGITNFSSTATYTFDSNYGYGYGYDDVLGEYTYGYGYGATEDEEEEEVVNNSNSGGGGGGWYTATCTDSNLVCKETNGVYKLFRKTGVSCKNGNLANTCIPTAENTVDSTDVTVVTPTTPSTETPTVTNPTIDSDSCTFPDLTVAYSDTANNWAVAYINDLSNKGIMNGNTSGLLNPVGVFEPWRETTRTEFLKIALRSYCYEYINEDTSSLTFTDVDKSTWQARVIDLWVDLGIVTTDNSTFRPNDSISRIEAMKMLLKVAETRNAVYTVDSSVTTSAFGDLTATWQAKYAEKARTLGIIANNANFEPNRGIKRDESAKVVVKSRALHY